MLRLDEPSVSDRILLAVRKERERAFGSRVERCYKVGVTFAVKGEVCASASEQVVGVLAVLHEVGSAEAFCGRDRSPNAPPYSAAEPG